MPVIVKEIVPNSSQLNSEVGRGTTEIVWAIVNGCSPAPVGIIDGDVGFDEAVAALGDPVSHLRMVP